MEIKMFNTKMEILVIRTKKENQEKNHDKKNHGRNRHI